MRAHTHGLLWDGLGDEDGLLHTDSDRDRLRYHHGPYHRLLNRLLSWVTDWSRVSARNLEIRARCVLRLERSLLMTVLRLTHGRGMLRLRRLDMGCLRLLWKLP